MGEMMKIQKELVSLCLVELAVVQSFGICFFPIFKNRQEIKS